MEIPLKSKSKTKCKNRFAEPYAEMQRSQDNFYWSQMLKHLPEQIRGPVPNKKEREQVIRHLRSKRSLEIQRYFNAMRDWIGEREMRTENRRFQWFASIALSCLTTSHLRRQPLSDTEQHVSAHVCKVRLADQPGTTPIVDTSAFPQYGSGETSEKRTSGPRSRAARRILSAQKGSAPFGKFSTLLYFSTGYKSVKLPLSDPILTVLTMELLQFYYSDTWVECAHTVMYESASFRDVHAVYSIKFADQAEAPSQCIKAIAYPSSDSVEPFLVCPRSLRISECCRC